MSPDQVAAELLSRWPLPGHPELAAELLERWSEAHRHYHGLRHLEECLIALDPLDAGLTETLALWFHDAVHRNRRGFDERESAALASERLASILGGPASQEVSRLILATREHRPEVGDPSAARVCDADLAILAADPNRYAESLRELRREHPGMADQEWQLHRASRTAELLARPTIFGTEYGLRVWERAARANLCAEGEQPTAPADDVRRRKWA